MVHGAIEIRGDRLLICLVVDKSGWVALLGPLVHGSETLPVESPHYPNDQMIALVEFLNPTSSRSSECLIFLFFFCCFHFFFDYL
jgi:hypothetical protein